MVLRHVDAGHAALARGEWEEARRAFEAALAAEEIGEALEGLGLAAWWLDLADVVFDARERAYRLYHEQNNRLGRGARGRVARVGHARPFAASTRSPPAGCSARAGCSTTSLPAPNMRGLRCARE